MRKTISWSQQAPMQRAQPNVTLCRPPRSELERHGVTTAEGMIAPSDPTAGYLCSLGWLVEVVYFP